MQTEQIALSCPVDKSVDNSATPSYYLDTYAKVRNLQKNRCLQQKKGSFLPVDKSVDNFSNQIIDSLLFSGRQSEAARLMECGQRWIPLECSKGHRIYKRKTCGLPYCLSCGCIKGRYSQKRFNRVKDVLLGFPQLGHYVFTLPKDVSRELPGPDLIGQCYRQAWRILREFFDAEATVIVLHLCGDKKDGLHIHFDATFPILYRNGGCDYPLEILRLARQEWTEGVNQIFKKALEDTVCHYNFVNTIEQEYHLIRYITRSTVQAESFVKLDDDQREYALKMLKKKTIRYFGKFVGKQKEQFLKDFKCSLVLQRDSESIDSLIAKGFCPICNEKMKVVKVAGVKRFPLLDDLPLMNLEVYNDNVLIDREIGAWLRGKGIEPIDNSLAEAIDCILKKEPEYG